MPRTVTASSVPPTAPEKASAPPAPAPKAPPLPKKPAIKIPKSFGLCADRLFELKAAKAEAQKAVDAIEAEEKALKEHLIENLPKSQQSGASGRVANAKVVTKIVPSVADWDKLYEHVKKAKGFSGFSLFQRRLAEGAVKEVWEAGKAIPGVEKFNAVTVSLTKL